MNLALSPTGERLVAFPREKAKCPSCGDEVIAKCGEIKQWHWAHAGREDCDPWSEPESEWHLGWKTLFDEQYREVVLPPHRADIKNIDGLVVELQHSAISPAEITERESFYRKMVWIVDGAPFLKNLSYNPQRGYVKFKWKWPRKTWFSAKKTLFIDTRDGYLFQPVKINDRGYGYGHFFPVREILEDYKATKFDPPLLAVRACLHCSRNGVMDCVCEFCGEMQ